MTQRGEHVVHGRSPRPSPLARAFWGWFVGGGLAALALGALSLFLIALRDGFAVLASVVWLLAIPAYAIVALVLVWRRGAQAPARWRWASRATVLATYALLAFALLVLATAPGDYTVKAKVQMGANLSNPARTALAVACSEDALAAGMGHDALALASAAEYSGTYTRAVRVAVESPTRATVTVVMRAIPGTGTLFADPGVGDGQTVVYTGTCGAAGMRWQVGGTVPARYRPRM